MSEHARVIRVTHFRPAAGRRQELEQLLKLVVEAAAGLEGCFGAQACTLEGDAETLVAISRWRDEEALRDALGSNEANLHGRLEGMLADAPQTEHYRPL